MKDSNPQEETSCLICKGKASELGRKWGKYRQKNYLLIKCQKCGFAWVANPDRDFEQIYNEKYYLGQNADPLVDYLDELENPESSIRQFEWQGILQVVKGLVTVSENTSWLDYGCGNGGLVRYVKKEIGCHILGYDTGWIADRARQEKIPIAKYDELSHQKFDVVTAIEVLEHVENPRIILNHIRSLMKPGGIFFYTTGNSTAFSKDFLKWNYVIPEIHISFYTPLSLKLLLSQTGFQPKKMFFNSGYSKIYAFKVLKNLRINRLSVWQKYIPWRIIEKALEHKFKLKQLPVGIAF